MRVADIILSQLGGNMFLACTGAKCLVAEKNGLSMRLPRNGSRANKLTITLNGADLYDMKFEKYTPFRFNPNTGRITLEKTAVLKVYNDLWFDQLQEIFTEYTKMYTHL